MSRFEAPLGRLSGYAGIQGDQHVITTKSISNGSLKIQSEERQSKFMHRGVGLPLERNVSEELEAQGQQISSPKNVWTKEQQKSLMLLHNSIGNCWTEIAYQLKKDHNAVKNHFYAQIRKSVRRINVFICSRLHKRYKELNLTQISKVLTMLSEKKKIIPNLSGEGAFSEQEIIGLKTQIFKYAKYSENHQLTPKEEEELEVLLNQIYEILEKLKNRGLIGKKTSAYKQAKKSKITKFVPQEKLELPSDHNNPTLMPMVKIQEEEQQVQVTDPIFNFEQFQSTNIYPPYQFWSNCYFDSQCSMQMPMNYLSSYLPAAQTDLTYFFVGMQYSNFNRAHQNYP